MRRLCGRYLLTMLRKYLTRKIILVILAITICVVILLPADITHLQTRIYFYLKPEKSLYCYHVNTQNTLEDISDITVRKGKSIFFHETSCRSYINGKISILSRQACAVESAARMNPNLDVYLTFSSPGIFKFEGTESDRMLQKLLEYKNVKILYLNVGRYTKNTPLEELYSKKILDYSFYPQSHTSDILRYLSLYKFGGIYLDTDVLVIKSLEELQPNYAGLESDRNVAAGVLSLHHEGKGHEHAKSCVMELKNHFKRNKWGANGPGVITRLLRKLCGVYLGIQMVDRDCDNFTVYPPKIFYPIRWEDWKMYFDQNKIQRVFNMARDSYVLHVWNKHSENIKIPVGYNTSYSLFAEKYCPHVYRECDTYF